ncbi:uncharacterized protein [Halyomorpha halys]|uniref:uncharacterized protein n=1 Tax=Halyomorpha halys TaxID=286706 RepID=UPI0034D21C58
MREYLTLDHMKIASPGTSAYIIPHHPVFKFHNGVNKLRVVFDPSCHSNSGSLNDHMYGGPKLQLEISNVLSSCRAAHQYVFTADIVKVYRQITVNHIDRKYQPILWKLDPTDEL